MVPGDEPCGHIVKALVGCAKLKDKRNAKDLCEASGNEIQGAHLRDLMKQPLQGMDEREKGIKDNCVF